MILILIICGFISWLIMGFILENGINKLTLSFLLITLMLIIFEIVGTRVDHALYSPVIVTTEKHTYYVDEVESSTSTTLTVLKNGDTITLFNPGKVEKNSHKRNKDCNYKIEVPAYGIFPKKYYTDTYYVTSDSVVFTDSKGKTVTVGDCKIIEINNLDGFCNWFFYVPVVGYYF